MVELAQGITVLTPTGDRHFCLKRCKYYLERQTLLPNQWLLIDDGHKKSAKFIKSELLEPIIDVVEREPVSNNAKSFTGNILSAIEHIKYNQILIIEDDDWYAPTYIERTVQRLRDCIICGEPRAVYYNIRSRRYRINQNDWRASFCQTAFRSDLLPKLKKLCYPRTSAFLDSRLWKHAVENKVPFRLFSDERLCVGIKGMPGRQGIGIGHRPGMTYKPDPDFKKLIAFVGSEDAQFYIQVYRDIKNKILP